MGNSNSYLCIWKGKKIKIIANSAYEAQRKAANKFRQNSKNILKDYEITVMLDESETSCN